MSSRPARCAWFSKEGKTRRGPCSRYRCCAGCCGSRGPATTPGSTASLVPVTVAMLGCVSRSARSSSGAVGPTGSLVNDRHLVAKALQMAIKRRTPEVGLLHHSEQGSPYTSEDCFDNAVIESWFSTLKFELGDTMPIKCREPAARGRAAGSFSSTNLVGLPTCSPARRISTATGTPANPSGLGCPLGCLDYVLHGVPMPDVTIRIECKCLVHERKDVIGRGRIPSGDLLCREGEH